CPLPSYGVASGDKSITCPAYISPSEGVIHPDPVFAGSGFPIPLQFRRVKTRRYWSGRDYVTGFSFTLVACDRAVCRLLALSGSPLFIEMIRRGKPRCNIALCPLPLTVRRQLPASWSFPYL